MLLMSWFRFCTSGLAEATTPEFIFDLGGPEFKEDFSSSMTEVFLLLITMVGV